MTKKTLKLRHTQNLYHHLYHLYNHLADSDGADNPEQLTSKSDADGTQRDMASAQQHSVLKTNLF